MSFTKVIKASKSQQPISSFVACCQEKSFQPQNKTNSSSNELCQGKLGVLKKENLKKESFWQNDTPSMVIHRYLLQNIFSLNSLSEFTKHDFSQFESEQFTHVLSMSEEDGHSGVIQTETVKSQFIESVRNYALQSISDNESVFEFQFENEGIPQTKA